MQTTSSHLNPPGILQAQAYEAKENVNYNNIQPSNAMMQSSTACRPSTAPSFGSDSPFIEHTRRDSRGLSVTKRYLKGSLLGKGGFAKCFKITDADTKVDWACKVVQKSSLTKQRHKVKVETLPAPLTVVLFQILLFVRRARFPCLNIINALLSTRELSGGLQRTLFLLHKMTLKWLGTQLQTEIKIHKSLGHKHVVRFEDVFEDKEHVYIIMELCTNQVRHSLRLHIA
jgi:serine/threonine protein kinase